MLISNQHFYILICVLFILLLEEYKIGNHFYTKLKISVKSTILYVTYVVFFSHKVLILVFKELILKSQEKHS